MKLSSESKICVDLLVLFASTNDGRPTSAIFVVQVITGSNDYVIGIVFHSYKRNQNLIFTSDF